MQIVRTRQIAPPSPLTDFERLFDGFFSGSRTAQVARPWSPPVDVVETDTEIVLTADLPGMDPDDVAIEVADGILSVSGERRDGRQDNGDAGYRRIERSYGRFSRALRLPRGTDPEAVRANFDRGILEVHVAKPEQPRPHRVAIESGAGSAEKERPEAIEAKATETTDKP